MSVILSITVQNTVAVASLPHAVLKPANKLSIFCVEFYSVNHC